MGPLLARIGSVRLAPPGGDFPTRRTITTHVQALMALGARPLDESGQDLDAPDGLHGASFYLDEASVTGTETALLAAAAAEGATEIRHAACEPHVVELCEFLQAMGVPDRGRRHVDASASRASQAPRRDASAERRLHRGRAVGRSIAAVTKGEVEIAGARPVDLEPVTSVLRRMKRDAASSSDSCAVRERVARRPASAI